MVDVPLQTADLQTQLRELTRGAVDLVTAEELRERLDESLRTGRPLRVKAGFDPTAPDLHLGHTVLLTRMRRFQRFGHEVVFIIGDFTAAIGDPTGRNVTRPPLSADEIARNAKTFQAQVFKILDETRTVVRFNSEWLEPLGARGIIELSAKYTVARMLERDDFKRRFAAGHSIGIHEFLYPLLQGYDSVALDADIELGGTDQLFNLLVGRHLMKSYGKRPQIVLTSPLLEGIDAKEVDGILVGEKMSKSHGNYVGIDEPPDAMYGKLMSISDALMWRYLELLSDRSLEEIAGLRKAVASGERHPKAVKSAFAKEIVARYHGQAAAEAAEAEFERVHARREVPEEVEERPFAFQPGGSPIADVLTETGLAKSKSEARRLVKQGGVKVDGERFTDPQGVLPAGQHLIQVGKRRFLRVRPA
ncbi:MAG: tyrosine--tRNA ligase [Deltaproteobacteria bacterium]|nr:MAG: tyrosine--tRNA ligase [Deltaproteobacteria bacterium]